jgi:hypothetical protein
MKIPFSNTRDFSPRILLFVAALILAVAAYRVASVTVLPGLPNFSPVMAIAFCGAFFLRGLTAWVLPFGALLISDVALSAALGYPIVSGGALAAWACVAVAIAMGRWMVARGWVGGTALFGGVVANSFLFYLVTNTVSWVANPAYVKSAAGWVQALTVGLPGFPPTWVFFRNSLASDLLFSGMILAVVWIASSVKVARSEPVRA